MIHFQCPQCQATLKAPENRAGAKRPCPSCGFEMRIPLCQPSPAKESAHQAATPLNEAALPPPVPARGPPNTRSCQVPVVNAPRPDFGPLLTVQISARIIRWPVPCACCLAPATTTRSADAIRVKGVRVVRTDSRSWSVPYCRFCSAHVEGFEARRLQAAALLQEAEKRAGVLPVARNWAIGVVAVLLLVIAGSIIKGWQNDGAKNAVVGVFVVLAAGLGVAIYFGLTAVEKSVRQQARDRAEDLSEEGDALAGKRCCRAGVAVIYEGWEGSVHTFLFGHPDYLAEFIRLNPGKILG